MTKENKKIHPQAEVRRDLPRSPLFLSLELSGSANGISGKSEWAESNVQFEMELSQLDSKKKERQSGKLNWLIESSIVVYTHWHHRGAPKKVPDLQLRTYNTHIEIFCPSIYSPSPSRHLYSSSFFLLSVPPPNSFGPWTNFLLSIQIFLSLYRYIWAWLLIACCHRQFGTINDVSLFPSQVEKRKKESSFSLSIDSRKKVREKRNDWKWWGEKHGRKKGATRITLYIGWVRSKRSCKDPMWPTNRPTQRTRVRRKYNYRLRARVFTSIVKRATFNFVFFPGKLTP